MDELRALSVSHVVYKANDPVGYFLAIITLTPIFIAVHYATLLIFRRDSSTIFMCLGQAMSLALNVVLKKLIDQPRPGIIEFEGEGMPSNHAQFTCFFCVYMLISVLRSKPNNSARVERIVSALFLILLAPAVAVSRVYLGYHTTEQVVVGAVVGVLTAFLWHIIYDTYGRACMTQCCESVLGRWLYLRDYTHSTCAIVAIDEYHAWLLYNNQQLHNKQN